MALNPRASTLILEHNKRVATILESPEGLAAPKLARELALRSEMSAAAAIDILKQVPAETKSVYADAMQMFAPVGITADPTRGQVGGETDREKREAELREVAAHHNAVRGYRKD